MICRAIGFVIAAIIVGLITWWLIGTVPVVLAIIAFLGLFALGLWLVMAYCGTPNPAVASEQVASAAPAAASVAATSDAAAPAAAAPESAAPETAEQAEARRKAEAVAAADAKRKADAAAKAAAKAKADARAAAAREKAAADAAAAAAAEEERRAEEGRIAAEAEAKAKADAQAVAAAAAGTSAPQPAAASDADAGSKPATLSGARDGNPDDLKQIKGVGPKMEAMLNDLGFYHFDQIASWSAEEVAWVDANLEGFKGRVSRDEWVKQAGILATGGETEFSKRVEDGDVY